MPYLFGILWSLVVVLLDVLVGYDIARQTDSSRYVATTGTITHSEVVWWQDSDGDVFSDADIRYRYDVAGRTFVGNTYRYSTAHFHTSDSGWAERAVRSHRVGASVTVYLDPRDTARSLLKPDFGGSELYLIMFMAPFNAVMLTIWLVDGPWLWRRLRGVPQKLPAMFQDGATMRMRLVQNAGVVAALASLGAASFIGIFVKSVDASFASMQITWAVMLTVAALLGFWLWREQSGGAFDLIIGNNTVTLPERFGRWRRAMIERSAITSVTVKPGWRGLFANQIRIQCRDGRSEKIAAWYDEEAASALATQLNETLGIAPTVVER